MFGPPPKNYIPGVGRGAAGFTTRSDVGPAAAVVGAGSGSRSAEARAAVLRQQNEDLEDVDIPTTVAATGGQYDDDDDEADNVWAAIDERMKQRRTKAKKTSTEDHDPEADGRKRARVQIEAQFHELKLKLADVKEEEWANIPDVGDYSLKHKKRKQQDVLFTPVTDTLLEQRSKMNMDATAGNTALAATMTVDDGFKSSVVSSMSGLSAARGTVLGMSLDRMADTGTATSVDPHGYLTSLSTLQTSSVAVNVADVNKARLLLKSVRDTNPKHAPGWIAAARVEEAAGKILQARKIIQEACQVCPDSEDVWLEAARLHPAEVAKSIIATAVRRIPSAVKLFFRAAELETTDSGKRAVLRKGLETNPTSISLWKAAIDLEEAEDARILLQVAVEKVPHSAELWLALARLESYQQAQKVLNRARKALPTDRTVWIAAAKLEESQEHFDVVDKVIERAVKSLEKNQVVITRAQWIQDAEAAETAGAPRTSAAIISQTIGKDVDPIDRLRTWSEDARTALARGFVATARAILSHALCAFPTKRSLWTQAVELERKHGTAQSLDEVLKAASVRLPQVEIFWLLRAKEHWLAGDVDKAREILTEAFAANPESETVWLAAAKLERENGEIDRARFFFQKARERAPTARVYMKAAHLEREEGEHEKALALIEEGIDKFPTFEKLYMMGGQICSDDLPKQKANLSRARKFYERGLQNCPNNKTLWILASRLEESVAHFMENGKQGIGATKARGLLELARLKNPKCPELWLEAIRLERRSGSAKLAETLMSKALQECPTSGVLLAENIRTSSRVEQKSKSADAIKRCPDDPLVIAEVASLFASERKHEKARKWFDRAAVLNPDLGDTWARFYAFELVAGTHEQQNTVKERCIAAEPKHGELWAAAIKNTANRKKSMAEILDEVARKVSEMVPMN